VNNEMPPAGVKSTRLPGDDAINQLVRER